MNSTEEKVGQKLSLKKESRNLSVKSRSILFLVVLIVVLIPKQLGTVPKFKIINIVPKTTVANSVINHKEIVKEKNMSINKDHLRTLIIEVLTDFEPVIPYSKSAVEQLMMTAAQESHLGTYLRQVGIKQEGYGGYGIFQIEIPTHNDIWDRDLNIINDNFLSYKKHLELLANKYYNHSISLEMNLKANLPYQILIARLIYFRVRPALPKHYDIEAMAYYYKKHFNTYRGKAKVIKVIKNYKRFCL